MSAIQEWLDFRADLAHPPTREGFCGAWRQMTGRDAPIEAVRSFGRTVLPLFIHACDEANGREDFPSSITAVLDDAMKTGLLLGFKPSDYGYDIQIEKLPTAQERTH